MTAATRLRTCLPALVLCACAPATRTPTVNQPPLPELRVPASARAGERVLVDGEASRDLEGAIADGFILFGDGSDPVVGLSAEHAWAAPGLYLIELYVEDGQGATARARARIEVVP